MILGWFGRMKSFLPRLTRESNFADAQAERPQTLFRRLAGCYWRSSSVRTFYRKFVKRLLPIYPGTHQTRARWSWTFPTSAVDPSSNLSMPRSCASVLAPSSTAYRRLPISTLGAGISRRVSRSSYRPTIPRATNPSGTKAPLTTHTLSMRSGQSGLFCTRIIPTVVLLYQLLHSMQGEHKTRPSRNRHSPSTARLGLGSRTAEAHECVPDGISRRRR